MERDQVSAASRLIFASFRVGVTELFALPV